MAVRRLSQSFLSTRGRGKASSFIAGYGFGVDEMDLLQRATVGAGGTSAITFSSIPQTYQHLHLRGILRYNSGTTGEAMSWIQFNGDSTTSYSGHILYGNGTTVTSYAESSRSSTWLIECVGNGVTASVYGGGLIDILDYASTTKNKVIRGLSGFDANGSGFIIAGGGALHKTPAVTSISVLPNSGYTGFLQHSTLSLYGVVG